MKIEAWWVSNTQTHFKGKVEAVGEVRDRGVCFGPQVRVQTATTPFVLRVAELTEGLSIQPRCRSDRVTDPLHSAYGLPQPLAQGLVCVLPERHGQSL